MKTLSVPVQNLSLYEADSEKMRFILKEGVEANIDQVNWQDQFPKELPVTVHVAHDNEKLYLLYSVMGEQLRAVNIEDFNPVWQDSCVEFFMQRDGEADYRNFECNVLGSLLSRKHESRDKGEVQSKEIMSSITRFSTIQHRYENGNEVSDWTMFLGIPKKALGFDDDEKLSGQKIRANFYKCGDETPEPHYLSWNPIELPSPNFHVPQFFGLLEFE